MSKQLHMSKLIELARIAAADTENLREDGSIIWDFVSADLHIDTDEKSDRIETAISKLAKSMESGKFIAKSVTLTITQKHPTMWTCTADSGNGYGFASTLQGILDRLTDYATDLKQEMK